MRLRKGLALVFTAMLLVNMSAVPTLADESDPTIHAVPASVMIYPLFDAQDDTATYISVTNTNSSRSSCNSPTLEGDVCLHYIYINKDPLDADDDCDEFDRFECLTPGDTLTVDVSAHNPERQQGWLWVEARDPQTFEPIDFDYLIGSAIIVEATTDFAWSYTPYAFKGKRETNCDGQSICGYYFTDCDHEGDADFNGNEYEYFPNDILLDQFFAEGHRNINSQITLMSVKQNGDTNVSAFIWNNDEVRFSRGFAFECFSRAPLTTISNIVTDANLGGVINQNEPFRTGWIEFNAADGILGVYRHRKANFVAGKELFTDGTQSASIDR